MWAVLRRPGRGAVATQASVAVGTAEQFYLSSGHSGVDRKRTSVGAGGGRIGGRGFGGGIIEPELGAERAGDLGRAPFLLDTEALLVPFAERQLVHPGAGAIDQM